MNSLSPLRAAAYSGFSNVVTTALILTLLRTETTLLTAALLMVGAFGSGFIIAALLIGHFDVPKERSDKVFRPRQD